MIVQTIEISLSKGRAPELLAHLGESNRQIEMIPDVTLPETAGAEVDIVKPDGTFAIQTAEITDGHIIVTLPDQACTVKGLSHYILKITDTGTVIYSAYGNIFVDDHLITDDLIESIAEANGYVFPDDFLTDDKIVANPSGSATVTLYRLKILDTIYNISGGGGTDVEANPTGTPTDTLNTIRIDENIYNMGGSISNLSDVNITTPQQGQAIIYDNNKWVNGSIIRDRFSLNEHVVGTWVDGKNVYEKTIYYAGGVTGEITVPHGIGAIETLVDIWGTATDTYGDRDIRYVMPRISNDSNNFGIKQINAANITYFVPKVFQDRIVDVYFTMKYTKPTT
jgi:hypothetical protein